MKPVHKIVILVSGIAIAAAACATRALVEESRHVDDIATCKQQLGANVEDFLIIKRARAALDISVDGYNFPKSTNGHLITPDQDWPEADNFIYNRCVDFRAVFNLHDKELVADCRPAGNLPTGDSPLDCDMVLYKSNQQVPQCSGRWINDGPGPIPDEERVKKCALPGN